MHPKVQLISKLNDAIELLLKQNGFYSQHEACLGQNPSTQAAVFSVCHRTTKTLAVVFTREQTGCVVLHLLRTLTT